MKDKINTLNTLKRLKEGIAVQYSTVQSVIERMKQKKGYLSPWILNGYTLLLHGLVGKSQDIRNYRRH